MVQIETTELNITAYQRNAIAVKADRDMCKVVLNTGIEVHITCPSSKEASDVTNTILYYPTENENSAFDFRFKLIIKVFN